LKLLMITGHKVKLVRLIVDVVNLGEQREAVKCSEVGGIITL